MSSRLVTTPWFTKNLAGGWLGTGLLLAGHAGWERTGAMVPRTLRTAAACAGSAVGTSPRMIRPCSSRSTSATPTSRSARSGTARSSRRPARRHAARRRRPTSSRCCSRACCASTTPRSPTCRRSRAPRVVPAMTAALETVTARRDRPLLIAAAGTVPLPIRVDRPGEVGADRLVNALAVARLHGTPAVVVDLGTATTFDCVARRRGVRRRGDRAGHRAWAGRAGVADGEAAAGRAADAGPGDRAGHGLGDPERGGARLPGARVRAARPDPARARGRRGPRRRASPRRC